MYIRSEAMNGNLIPDRYGKHGEFVNELGIPTLSVPFSIVDAPDGTVSYAAVLDDVDSVPVCGFVWIHWLAANITKPDVAEGESAGADFVQGLNSWVSSCTASESTGYGGMAPPDAPHVYTLKVYALDTMLDLKEGFYYNELMHAIKGHVLAEAVAEGTYNN